MRLLRWPGALFTCPGLGLFCSGFGPHEVISEGCGCSSACVFSVGLVRLVASRLGGGGGMPHGAEMFLVRVGQMFVCSQMRLQRAV